MRSRREDTVVMTDLGSFFLAYFPIVLRSKRLRVQRIVFSAASATRLEEFFALSRAAQIGRILRDVWRQRRLAPLWCYGFLMRHRDRVTIYDPASFTPIPTDYLCSLGFMRRIPQTQIDAARSSSNIHWSLLPRYAGCHPYYWVFRHDERESGVTIHTITEDYDAGDIIVQRRIAIAPTDTADDFRAQAMRVSIKSFRDYLRDKDRLDSAARPQDRMAASFFGVPDDHDHRIEPDDDARVIVAKFRAAGPGRCYLDTPSGPAPVLAVGGIAIAPRHARPLELDGITVHVEAPVA